MNELYGHVNCMWWGLGGIAPPSAVSIHSCGFVCVHQLASCVCIQLTLNLPIVGWVGLLGWTYPPSTNLLLKNHRIWVYILWPCIYIHVYSQSGPHYMCTYITCILIQTTAYGHDGAGDDGDSTSWKRLASLRHRLLNIWTHFNNNNCKHIGVYRA